MSYVCTELSANLRADGRCGFELRDILEGPAWSQWDPASRKCKLHLDNLQEASKTHEMLVGVQVGLTTSDGYLILQRRSNLVQSAAGGVTSSGAGAAKWDDFCGGATSLVKSALREINEEIGWKPDGDDDISTPFLGAAFNLLRGRDLNFYCYFHTKRKLQDVSEYATHAKDAWEVAHLIPVPVEAIAADGTLDPRFDLLVGSGRHVRGLLYCIARSNKFREIQQTSASIRRE